MDGGSISQKRFSGSGNQMLPSCPNFIIESTIFFGRRECFLKTFFRFPPPLFPRGVQPKKCPSGDHPGAKTFPKSHQ